MPVKVDDRICYCTGCYNCSEMVVEQVVRVSPMFNRVSAPAAKDFVREVYRCVACNHIMSADDLHATVQSEVVEAIRNGNIPGKEEVDDS